jgi:cytochrome c556
MKSSTLMLASGALLVLAGAGIGSGLAQDAATVVKDRQTAMRQQYRNLMVVKDFMDGKAGQPAAVAAADQLVQTVPKIPDMFPPGTGMAPPEGKYKPKPEVWTQRNRFLAEQKTVVDQVNALDAAVKSGDKQRIATAFTTLNGCNACHDDFREKIQ